MTRLQGLLVCSFAAPPVALVAKLALAAPPPALDYGAPAGCPDVDSFVVAVEARGASFATVPGAGEAGARRLLVRIEPAERGFTGSLTVQSGAEASEPRRVQGASCAEVNDALAVVTAIALQRDAEAAPAAGPAEPAAPAQPLPAAAPARAEVAPDGPIPVVMTRQDIQVPSGKLVLDHTTRYTLAAGVQLGAIPGVVLPRLDLDISRTNVVRTPDERAFVLGNEFRVRWTVFGPAQHQAPGYETSLLGIKAGIAGCTPLTYNPTGLIVKACSEFTAGILDLTTRAKNGGFRREKTQALAVAGVEADVQYNFSRLLHLDLRAGGEFWGNRISAEREDGSRLFQAPLFNAHVMIGIGIHF